METAEWIFITTVLSGYNKKQFRWPLSALPRQQDNIPPQTVVLRSRTQDDGSQNEQINMEEQLVDEKTIKKCHTVDTVGHPFSFIDRSLSKKRVQGRANKTQQLNIVDRSISLYRSSLTSHASVAIHLINIFYFILKSLDFNSKAILGVVLVGNFRGKHPGWDCIRLFLDARSWRRNLSLVFESGRRWYAEIDHNNNCHVPTVI